MLRTILHKTLTGLCAVMPLGAGVTTALATAINVPGDQPTIQAGIDAAVNGDTVLVAPGTYNEAISLGGKAIALQSSGGADVTTIDATAFDTSAIDVPDTGGAGATVIQGFTISGGKGTLIQSPPSTSRIGGGVRITGGTTTLIGCKLTGNQVNSSGGTSGGGIYYTGAGSLLTIVDCQVLNNGTFGGCSGGTGGGLASSGANLVIIGSTFSGNSSGGSCAGTSGGWGGGLYMSSSALLINCVVHSNGTSGGIAGAGGIQNYGSATLINCRVSSNNSLCINCAGTSSSGVANSGGISLYGCTVVNNTLAGLPPGAAGGLFNSTSAPPASLYNCILVGNEGQQISPTSVAQFSCIQGGYPGTGNIDADPLFVDAARGDYHLQDGSPCRDAGDRTLLPADTHDLDGDGNTLETLSRDLDGLRRIVNGQVDMGAYEWQHVCVTDVSPSSPGVAGDGIINIDDLLTIINGWGVCDQCLADIDGDDDVDIDDLLAVINGWGACK
jgi:hypothetical protein